MAANIFEDIINNLMKIPNPSREDLNRIKIRIAEKYRLRHVPSNSEIIQHLTPLQKTRLLKVLRRKTVRSASGVTIIAAMTRPWPCPQKEPCAYCPGGPSQGVPQSYTGHEPAALRGWQNEYDPFKQVRQRIEQYTAIGHTVDKVCLLYTSPSPRDLSTSRMPSSA